MLGRVMTALWGAVTATWRACWWAVTLPLQFLSGGGAPSAPGVDAYEEEADRAGPAEPAQHQAEPVKAVRRAAARRLAAMEEGRDPAADDRLPAWTSTWLSSLSAPQLQTVMSMPGTALADVLFGARSGRDLEMEAMHRMVTQPRVPIADRMRAKAAARAVEAMVEPGIALGR